MYYLAKKQGGGEFAETFFRQLSTGIAPSERFPSIVLRNRMIAARQGSAWIRPIEMMAIITSAYNTQATGGARTLIRVSDLDRAFEPFKPATVTT